MSLQVARAALARGDADAALASLDALPETDETLALRAQAAYAAGRFEACVASYERLFRRQEEAGDAGAAAMSAATVALHLLVDSGLLAPVRGWVARARRLAGDEPGPVHAVLALVTTYERFLAGDPEAAAVAARDAVALGTAHGVAPAVTMGTVATGRLLVEQGEVVAGLALLDEVAVQLTGDELDAFTTGNTYCELVCAAQALGMPDRAREWTDVMDRWRPSAVGASSGRCRVHRAELLRMSGPADEAEAEALRACAELAPWMRRELGWPLVELGNIRLRRGDLAGAEEAFTAGHDRAWDAQPGLALLRLAQGDPATAAALVAQALAHPVELPWKERPPFGELRLAPLWEAQAEIAVAVGDAEAAVTARAAATGLRDLAARFDSPGLDAAAALAGGRAALLEGDPDTAAALAQRAVGSWTALGAPYDAAQARLVLADALAAAGNRAGAVLEWNAAAAAFTAYGAPVRADDARARTHGATGDQAGDQAGDRADVPTPATASLVRRGAAWEAGFRDAVVVLPDLKGLGYLHRLLAAPGVEVAALDLVGAAVDEPALPVIDEEAKAAYRRRLAEVEDDLAEAARDHDLARVALAERDRDYLVAELTGALGLGGRLRASGGTAERARGAATRALRYALDKVAEHHPDLGAHLALRVRTGTWCCYRPDPLEPLAWRLE
ncbi:hypothetical protein [Nocardioides rubriscoriae]|uniref:hypothetical protein n=1 Tax=Nocardioides rubriscoriae TaxID=642762 RepID=UPI0011DFF633|nr:hypothetical protein [Nocardioides rubriscoriae]